MTDPDTHIAELKEAQETARALLESQQRMELLLIKAINPIVEASEITFEPLTRITNEK